MKRQLTRYTCDAPDCEDVVDVEGPPATPTTLAGGSDTLPDGWIEFSVTGSTAEGGQRLVHASRPECAAAMATAQAEDAAQVAENRKRAEDEQRERAEKAAEAAREAEQEEAAPPAEGEEDGAEKG